MGYLQSKVEDVGDGYAHLEHLVRRWNTYPRREGQRQDGMADLVIERVLKNDCYKEMKRMRKGSL